MSDAEKENPLSQSQRSESNPMFTSNDMNDDLTQGSILEKYRFENKDLLYFCRPDTSDIFLMDFKKNKFFKEHIKENRLPHKFSTIQTSDSKIYIIGGYR